MQFKTLSFARRRATCLLAALAVGACMMATGEAGAQAAQKNGDSVRVTPDQLRQLDIVQVETYPFRLQRSAIGQIAFNEDTSTLVLTPFSGRVTRLIAKIGERVKRGDPLLEIDSSEVVQPQNDFIAAVAAMNKAHSQLQLARIVEKRQKDLYQEKAAPLKEWQQAQVQLVGAENDMRSAETTLEAARHRLRILGRTDDEITVLQEKGAIARTIPIHAPIDGTVIARKIGPGQFVRSDLGEALYAIADLSTMWLKAYVPDKDVLFMRVGQQIEVRIIAVPDRVFKARVMMIGASSDAATRRVVVRSEIPNPDGVLKAEMFASFKISTGESQSAPAVPLDALIREGDLTIVWVQQEPTVFRRRMVKTGTEQDGRVQIMEGLAAGELVVARGAIFVDNEWRQ